MHLFWISELGCLSQEPASSSYAFHALRAQTLFAGGNYRIESVDANPQLISRVISKGIHDD